MSELKSKIVAKYGSLSGAPTDIHRGYTRQKSRLNWYFRTLIQKQLNSGKDQWFKRKQTSPEGLQGGTKISLEYFRGSLRIPESPMQAQRTRVPGYFFGSLSPPPSMVNVLTALVELGRGRSSDHGMMGQAQLIKSQSPPPESQEMTSITARQLAEGAEPRFPSSACKWGTCAVNMIEEAMNKGKATVSSHIRAHTMNSLTCKWDWCLKSFPSLFELRRHLKYNHEVIGRAKSWI